MPELQDAVNLPHLHAQFPIELQVPITDNVLCIVHQVRYQLLIGNIGPVGEEALAAVRQHVLRDLDTFRGQWVIVVHVA